MHPTGNPFHFVGALLIIPAAIEGANHARVRTRTKQTLHEVAYPALSRRLAIQIAEDRREPMTVEAARRRADCGAEYDATPAVGQRWDRFLSCQSRAYHRSVPLTPETEAGPAESFRDSTNRWHVRVREGEIVEVRDLKALERECGALYRARPSVGDDWDAFRRCQSRRFRRVESAPDAPEGPLVFEDTAGAWQIRVQEGRIVGWAEIDGRTRRPTPLPESGSDAAP